MIENFIWELGWGILWDFYGNYFFVILFIIRELSVGFEIIRFFLNLFEVLGELEILLGIVY